MEQLTRTGKLIDPKYSVKAIDYDTYKTMVTGLLAENKVTGVEQSDPGVNALTLRSALRSILIQIILISFHDY